MSRMRATRFSKCYLCPRPIARGSWIARAWNGGWSHAECAEAALAARKAHYMPSLRNIKTAP